MRRVLYVAHPLAPTPEEVAAMLAESNSLPSVGGGITEQQAQRNCISRNINLALRWLAWLRASFPQDTFIAPWIATVMSLHGDDSPELREAGLRDDCATVERCDGIALTGSRLSSGMRREQRHGEDTHDPAVRFDVRPFWVFDFTVLGLREPPNDGRSLVGLTLDAWFAGIHDHLRGEVPR